MIRKVRTFAFWSLDFLRGSRLRNHYNDVKFIQSNYNSKTASSRRGKYLERILSHATQTTSFYKEYDDFKNISDFPIVNKGILKENYNDFISNKFSKDNLYKVTTSGSTGAPFTTLQDKNKRNRHTAENIYFNHLAGYAFGSKLYYFRIWNNIVRKSRILSWMQNICMEEATDLSPKFISAFLSRSEKDKSSKSLLAYASTYEPIGAYLNSKKPLKTNYACIISMSETLPDQTKLQLINSFNCPVVSRYSNMENGFIAQQCIEDNNEYHINGASFFLEFLNLENDEYVQPGQPGRIVLTDLFNYAFPFIRYDTGDVGILSNESSCSLKTPVISKIEGRRVDFITDTKGNLLSPHVITNTLWFYSDIKQFQFIQKNETDYLLKLNVSKKKYERSKQLINDLKYYLGTDATITIQYEDRIPTLASGKQKKIINLQNT